MLDRKHLSPPLERHRHRARIVEAATKCIQTIHQRILISTETDYIDHHAKPGRD